MLLTVVAAMCDPALPTGLGAGLRAVADEPCGPYPLVLLVLGLITFAVHRLVDARCRKA
jgi:hypothetical protein